MISTIIQALIVFVIIFASMSLSLLYYELYTTGATEWWLIVFNHFTIANALIIQSNMKN